MSNKYYLMSVSNSTFGKTEVESLDGDSITHDFNLAKGKYVLHIEVEGKKEGHNAIFKYEIPISLSGTEDGASQISYTHWDDKLKHIYHGLVDLIELGKDIEEFSRDHREELEGIEKIDYPSRKRNNLIFGSFGVFAVFGFIFWFFFFMPTEYDGIYIMKSVEKPVSQNTSFFPLVPNGVFVKEGTELALGSNHYLEELLVKFSTQLEDLRGDKNQLEEDAKKFHIFMGEKRKLVGTQIKSLQASIESKIKLLEALNLQNSANKKIKALAPITKKTNQLRSESLSAEILSMQDRLRGLQIVARSFLSGLQIGSNDPGDSYGKKQKIASYEAEITILEFEIAKRKSEKTLFAWCDCIYLEDYFFDTSFRRLHLAKNEQYVVFQVKKRLYPEIIGANVEVDGIRGTVVSALRADQKKYFGFPNTAFSAFKSQVVVAKLEGDFDPQVFGYSTIVKVFK